MHDTIVTGAVSLCNSNLIVRVIKSKYLRNFKLEILFYTDKRLVLFPRNRSVSSTRLLWNERNVIRNVYINAVCAGKKEKKIKKKKRNTRSQPAARRFNTNDAAMKN